jgi:two-component system LytT family response regulator
MMPAEIKVIIVDDEDHARDSLREELKRFKDIKVIAECHNGFDAVKAVQNEKPDVVFLDIQMPKLDGFDVVELLGDDSPVVVFVTAYDEYAIRAFETEALDYLLKPVNHKRLKKTIARIHEALRENQETRLSRLVSRHKDDQGPLNRILIRDGTDVNIIPVEDITYIEAQDDYISICTENKSYLKNETLSRIEEMLDPQNFCRIHRSYILNIDYLKKIEPYSKGSRIAKLKNGRTVPISRSGYNRLMELM